ncbi:hypothetical protein A11A3_16370 [Alcanivorax hongdengensis A-11-3]|uniref:Fe-S protein n=1 Tax=Alcanivorax hongdengensis A-11-3 TaxID=1177179 RepID=L0W884_9GAMM|nr:DUF1289 domain-containing protein [Alcanivorax hongdengensis]EKF72908.1 hypothetical protein A11A3_16370 [Alcanivorax hongdengensis A-11-3]
MSVNRIRTPCIGVCSTVFGDTVCRGCRRFSHEVVDWNGYTDEQKQIVWRRLDLLLTQVVDNYFQVADAALLAEQLDFQNLRYQPQLSPQGWVPELLKAAGRQQLDYHRFGLHPLPGSEGLSPRQLYDRISAECHALAKAHYDRSFARPVTLVADLAAHAAREKGLL